MKRCTKVGIIVLIKECLANTSLHINVPTKPNKSVIIDPKIGIIILIVSILYNSNVLIEYYLLENYLSSLVFHIYFYIFVLYLYSLILLKILKNNHQVLV